MLGSAAQLLKKKSALVALGVLVASAGFVVGSQYAFAVEAPTWEAGDTWHYTATFRHETTIPAEYAQYADEDDLDDMNEEETHEVWMRVLSADQQVGGIPVYGIAFSDDGVMFGDDGYVTQSDLNPLIVVEGRPIAVDALVEVEA